MAAGALVCVAQIGAPHGVRGEVRLRVFADDPAALSAYAPLRTGSGREVAIARMRPAGDMFVAAVEGVTSREAAEALRNQRLYVARERLPAPGPDEWYHADLIGLAAEDADGGRLGRVVAVQDFGAGDLLEIELAGGRRALVPFTGAFVPVVDVAAGRVVVASPAGLLDPPGKPDAEERR